MREFVTAEQARLHILSLLNDALMHDGIQVSENLHIDPHVQNIVLRVKVTEKSGEKKQIAIKIE